MLFLSKEHIFLDIQLTGLLPQEAGGWSRTNTRANIDLTAPVKSYKAQFEEVTRL